MSVSVSKSMFFKAVIELENALAEADDAVTNRRPDATKRLSVLADRLVETKYRAVALRDKLKDAAQEPVTI